MKGWERFIERGEEIGRSIVKGKGREVQKVSMTIHEMIEY